MMQGCLFQEVHFTPVYLSGLMFLDDGSSKERIDEPRDPTCQHGKGKGCKGGNQIVCRYFDKLPSYRHHRLDTTPRTEVYWTTLPKPKNAIREIT